MERDTMEFDEQDISFFEHEIIQSNGTDFSITISNDKQFIAEIVITKIIAFAKRNNAFFYGISIESDYIRFRFFAQ